MLALSFIRLYIYIVFRALSTPENPFSGTFRRFERGATADEVEDDIGGGGGVEACSVVVSSYLKREEGSGGAHGAKAQTAPGQNHE